MDFDAFLWACKKLLGLYNINPFLFIKEIICSEELMKMASKVRKLIRKEQALPYIFAIKKICPNVIINNWLIVNCHHLAFIS